MNARKLRGLALGLVAASSLALMACSDNDTTADDVSKAVSEVQGKQQELCQKLTDLQTSLNNASNLNSSSTVEEAKQAQEDVQNAVDEVKKAAGDVSSSRGDAIETAAQSFGDTLGGLENNQSLGSAATTIKSDATAIQSALSGLKGDAACPS